MAPAEFKVGQKVAWLMADRNVMAGEITFVGISTYAITRVDGGQCAVKKERVWGAASADIEKACEFYTAYIGR